MCFRIANDPAATMPRRRLRVVACALILCSFAPPVRAGSRQDAAAAKVPDLARIRQLIRAQLVETPTPSLAVAVARHGEILWEEGFGWADRENRVPADEHTPYYLASVSKSITATALMLLHERKQIDLDRPVNDYLGTSALSSPRWNPALATVRRVATHTSGLTTYDQAWPASRTAVDETIRRYGVLIHPPGELFDYSNLGYGILGEVVSRVSGRSYADFLRAEVFVPLGMNRASLGVGPGLEKVVAARYSAASGRSQWQTTLSGASGVYASAHDLALFGMFHLKAHVATQKAILSDSSIEAMQNSAVRVDDGGGQYGLGFWVNPNLYGYRGVLAQGGTDDAQAWLQMIPSEGLVVVVLANSGGPVPSRIVHEILSALLPKYGERRAAEVTGKKTESAAGGAPAPALAGNWTGSVRTYAGELPLRLWISPSGDVHVKLAGYPTALLDDAQFDGGKGVSGRMLGDLGTDEDTGPGPYILQFWLSARDGALQGCVTTESGPRRWTPRLSYWVELTKAGARE